MTLKMTPSLFGLTGKFSTVIFFEDMPNPNKLHSGPGGSSMMGLFSEIGPCLMEKEEGETIRNEHSWTNFANVLFIE